MSLCILVYWVQSVSCFLVWPRRLGSLSFSELLSLLYDGTLLNRRTLSQSKPSSVIPLFGDLAMNPVMGHSLGGE